MSLLVAITVSVHYDDYLKLCLPNAALLDHWYIVVDPRDQPTLDLVKDLPNVTTVPFDFQADGCLFNKSGGIRAAQTIAHDAYPDAWILLLDSDIILPDTFRDTLNATTLNPNMLYGASRAFYFTLDQLERDQPPPQVKHRGCWGFFHLYFDKTKYCLERAETAARYDDRFKDDFGRANVKMLPIVVKHLGDEIKNWRGRVSQRFA